MLSIIRSFIIFVALGTFWSCESTTSTGDDSSTPPQDSSTIIDTIADSDSSYINDTLFLPTIKTCKLIGAGYTITLSDGIDSITFYTNNIMAGTYEVRENQEAIAGSLWVDVSSTFGEGTYDGHNGSLKIAYPQGDSIFTGVFSFVTNFSTYEEDTTSITYVRGEFIEMLGVYALDTTQRHYLLKGRGIQSDPFLIESREDLYGFADDTFYYQQGVYVQLTADIDLSPALQGGRALSTALIAPDISDDYLGYRGHSYLGVFDGGGHRITHLTIDDSSATREGFGADYNGLFGSLSGTVHNLIVDSARILGDDYLGILAGEASYAMVENVHVQGEVHSSNYVDAEDAGAIGGLIGDADVGNIIRLCSSNSHVYGLRDVGGLVGHMLENNSIEQCFSQGAATASERYAGGLVGFRYMSRIENCFSWTAVSGPYSAGFLGSNNGGKTINCYALGAVEATTYSVGFEPHDGMRNCFWSPSYAQIANGYTVYDSSSSSWVATNVSKEGVLVGLDSSSFAWDSTFIQAGWNYGGVWEQSTNALYGKVPVLSKLLNNLP